MADNRGPWIIAAAIVFAAGIIVGGFIWWQAKENSCERWREDYRAAIQSAIVEVGGQGVGATPGPSVRRAVDVSGERPEGCDAPEVGVPGFDDDGQRSQGSDYPRLAPVHKFTHAPLAPGYGV